MVVSAIKELFHDGLADPRGCEYREIEIGESGNWLTAQTHGWVLPGNGSPRFAVGLDGIVYPLRSVGIPVDLETDFPLGDQPIQ